MLIARRRPDRLPEDSSPQAPLARHGSSSPRRGSPSSFERGIPSLVTMDKRLSASDHRFGHLSQFTSGLPDRLKPEGELRAYPHYLEGFANELGWDIDITNNRIAPVVE